MRCERNKQSTRKKEIVQVTLDHVVRQTTSIRGGHDDGTPIDMNQRLKPVSLSASFNCLLDACWLFPREVYDEDSVKKESMKLTDTTSYKKAEEETCIES